LKYQKTFLIAVLFFSACDYNQKRSALENESSKRTEKMQTVRFGGQDIKVKLLYVSEFKSLDDFWCEGSPDVKVENGSLFIRTALERDERYSFISSVFCRKQFKGDILVEFDARSIHPGSHRNFNFFIHTAMTDGRDLYETRKERTGDYPEYHVMNNYLFTFLPDKAEVAGKGEIELARWRFRRDPGFQLMKEVRFGVIEQNRWYHFKYLVQDGRVASSVSLDPEQMYEWTDPKPLNEGYVGFRTFCSHMEYRNLHIWKVSRQTL
jgi:hypothetical protein